MDEQKLTDWFWGNTHASQVINEVRKSCLQHPRENVIMAGMVLLIPFDQMYRLKEQ